MILFPAIDLKADERELIVAASVAYVEDLGDPDPTDDGNFDDGFARPTLHVLGRLGLKDSVEVHGGHLCAFPGSGGHPLGWASGVDGRGGR